MWTIPNIISLFRLLLIVPFGYFVLNSMNFLALITGAVSGISDIADGYIARKLNQTSEIGKIIDPIADKLMIGTAAATMAYMNIVPYWFLAIAIARDAIILIGGLYISKRIGYVIPSNKIGKYTVVVIYLYFLFALLNLSQFSSILLWTSALGLFVSFTNYMYIAFKVLKKSGEH